MEFGSKYVYLYAGSDEEAVSDDEFETGITDESNPIEEQQDEDGSSPPAAAAAAPPPAQSKKGKKAPGWAKPKRSEEAAKDDQKKWRQADTNVVAIRFDQLTNPSNMHTGDAVSCRGCHAVMSHLSQITDAEADQKIWVCEFCSERNVVDILTEEIPSEPDVTYMISPAPATTATSCQGDESSLVIFCIDVSGSMGGRVGSLTRLQCVKAAVVNQLKQLRDEHPTRKVALITFDSSVSIFGDGTSEAKIVSVSSVLNDYQKLADIGAEAAIPGDIISSFNSLNGKIATLNPGDMTALGPALLISVFMASKVVGSRVVLCTDGCANVGVGNLSSSSSAASEFYTNLGETASSKGVVVSVLTVADTDCRLTEIGNVAQATGGHVNIVDPRKLTDELGEIFVSSLLAVRVSATFIVHRGLYIRGETEMTSSVTRLVGNVTKDTDITFEYGVRPQATWRNDAADEGATSSSSSTEKPTELPFQLQVTYTDLDGARAMRVLTYVKPVTSDRSEAETHINVPVITCHATKQSSKMMMEGDYTPSRLNALMNQRLVARNTNRDPEAYRVYVTNVAPLEQRVLAKQRAEARACRSTVHHYEDAVADEDGPSYAGLGTKLAMFHKHKVGALSKTNRKMQQSDPDASDMFRHLRMSVSSVQKK